MRLGGHAVLMEWNPKDTLVGPDATLRVSQKQLRTLVESVNLVVEKELNVGGFHYAFLVKK